MAKQQPYKKEPSNKRPLEKKKEPVKKKTTLGMIWEIVQTLLMAAVLYFAIDYCIARVRVENISMETTFTEGQLLMVNKLNYKFSEPKRGDVVIFEAPKAPGEDYIKRMIGLPGDHVEVKEGKLFINGNEIVEEWIHEPMIYTVHGCSGEFLFCSGRQSKPFFRFS